jgi:hypothetical protein
MSLTKGGYEMDETVLKIALAGLLHDIGKFSDEGVLNVSDEFINGNAGLEATIATFLIQEGIATR